MPASHFAGDRRRFGRGWLRKWGLTVIAAPSTAPAAAATAFAPPLTFAVLDGAFDNNGVGLGFAAAFRAERFVERLFLFRHR